MGDGSTVAIKKLLASIDIGNATVDTVLPSETVRPGETVGAEVRIVGGNATQEVGAIRFELEMRLSLCPSRRGRGSGCHPRCVGKSRRRSRAAAMPEPVGAAPLTPTAITNRRLEVACVNPPRG